MSVIHFPGRFDFDMLLQLALAHRLGLDRPDSPYFAITRDLFKTVSSSLARALTANVADFEEAAALPKPSGMEQACLIHITRRMQEADGHHAAFQYALTCEWKGLVAFVLTDLVAADKTADVPLILLPLKASKIAKLASEIKLLVPLVSSQRKNLVFAAVLCRLCKTAGDYDDMFGWHVLPKAIEAASVSDSRHWLSCRCGGLQGTSYPHIRGSRPWRP